MPLAREAVELLVQVTRAWHFEGDRHGLRDREWMALRFIRRANRFSRTPTALARFIGATKATASQIIKVLEAKSYLTRTPSHHDKRSVVLCVTPQGEKCLTQHDPVNQVMNAVAALGVEECAALRDSLGAILDQVDTATQRINANICRDCMFLVERSLGMGKGRPSVEFVCRLYRAQVSQEDTELLCTSFERGRVKIEEYRDRPRVAYQR